MNLGDFLSGLGFLFLSVMGCLYRKWWIKDKIKKNIELDGHDKTIRLVRHIGFIVLCLIMSILCFLDAVIE